MTRKSRIVRGLVFALSAVFVLFGPAYIVFDRGGPKWLPRWRMFSGKALELYEVSFEKGGPGGERVPIDRFEALGYTDPQRAPGVRRVESHEQVASLVRRLCQAEGAPIYMRLRDATRAGWRVIEDGQRDVCAEAMPVERQPSPVRRRRGGQP